jgi:hypothetical protein
MQLTNAKFGLHKTEFVLSESTPSLFLKIDNIGFNFSFEYDLKTEPQLISDKGLGSAYFDSL